MLILMQGPPGSGKSTIAVELSKHHNAKICCTDDFHYVNYEYIFDFNNIGYYHAWNQWECEFYLSQGINVIVDNTNIKQIHADPYIKLGKKYNQEIKIVRTTGNFESIHNVPKAIIERMKSEIEILKI